MTDLAQLSLRIDSLELKQAQRDLEKFGAAGDKTSGKMQAFGGVTTKALGAVAIAATAAFGAIAAGVSFSGAISEARDFQTTMLKIEAVIKATGGVAGKSADALREQARQIAFSTLESTEGVLRAQQTLLTFRNVQGDVFDRTIKAATDMAAALGGDLNSATMQLAKALENPTEGLSALSRSGTVFTAAQKEMVKGMVEANNMAGAQAFILSELEAQYGGAATAATAGLAGAQDTLAQAFQEAKLAFVENTGALEAAASLVNTTASAVIFLTENMDALGIALGIAAASGLPAVIAGLTGMTLGLGTASLSAIALGAALNLIPFVAVVTGVTLLYRAYRDMADTTGVTAAVTETMTESVGALNTALETYTNQKSEPARQAVLQSAIAMEADARATLANVEAKRALAEQAGANNPLFMESANQPGGILADLSLQIAEANRQLENARMTIQGITRETATASGAMSALAGAAGDATTKAESLLASLNAQVDMQATILTYGKDSAQVTALRAQQERDVFEATLATLDAAVEMKDQLRLSFSINQSLTAEVNATASAASNAAGAAGGLAGNIAQASAFAAQLVSNLGQVPAAIGAIAGQVDAAIGALQSQNSSLTYQLEQGLTASSAAIKTQRDEALKLAAANGATIDQMAAMGQSFDAQAAKAESLATANSGMTKTLSDNAAAAAKAASAMAGGGGGGGGGGGKGSLAGAAKEAGKAMKDAERDAENLAKQIEQLEFDADPVKKYAAALAGLDKLKAGGLSSGAYAKAVDDLNDSLAQSYPLVGDVSDAFGEFVAGGLKDFKGFTESILGSFKSMIAQMIATAARNKIMLSMGIGGGGVAGAAQAATGGGGLGGLGALGGLGSRVGAIGSVFASSAMGSLSTFATGGIGAGLSGIGASLGAATTSVAGFAAAAGSLVPVIGAAALAFSFFKSKTKELDDGIRLTIDGNTAMAESYRKVEKSRFFGLSKSKSTGYSAIEDSGLSDAYKTIYAGAEQASWALGLSSKALRGYTAQIELSTKGMDEAQANAAALEALQDAQNGLAGKFFNALGKGSRRLIQPGEEAGTAMQRLALSVQAAAPLLDVLGSKIELLGFQGAKSATNFVNALGGLQNAGAAVGAYINAFYSTEERAAVLRKQLVSGLNDLGIKDIPGSLAKYRAMIDKALANGNEKRAGQLISFAPAFAEWKGLRNDILDAAKAEKDAIAATSAARAKAAADARAQAAKDAAAAMAAILSERMGIQRQIWQQTGNEAALRADTLSGLNASNRALQQYAFRLADATAAEERAAQRAEEIASKAAARADERSGLERTILDLQGKTAALRALEVAALDPANRELQRRIYGLADAAAAEERASGIMSERLGLQRQIWELTGREDLIRKDMLSGLDASNRALQNQIWKLEDQKAATDAATDAIQAMIDAVSPEKFATRFAYDAALSSAARGMTASRITSTGVPIAAVPTPQVNSDILTELKDLRAEIKTFRETNTSLMVNGNADVRKMRLNSDRDQAIGLPRERSLT